MHDVSVDDRTFQRAFEACEFPLAGFDHRAHLRLAYVYLAERDMDAAHDATRAAILGFLQHHGVDASKYHETLTRAWLLAVRHFMVKAGATSCADDFIDRSSALLDAHVMLTHYSKELLFSDGARIEFVEPDRDPIPSHESTDHGHDS